MNKLTIIVLNYNDAKTTLNYIDDISSYSIFDHIIVVDNASTDDSFEQLSAAFNYENVDVIQTPRNGGYAYGNNFGIKYANDTYGESEYIIISNPDVEVKEEVIGECLNFLDRNENTAIVAPRMKDINGNYHPLSGWRKRTIRGDYKESNTCILAYRGFYRDESYMPYEYERTDALKVDCVAGSFFVARNSIFKEIGYFDEGTFLFFEEDIIGSKLKEAGYDNYILTKINFTHFESVSVRKAFSSHKKDKLMLKSRIYYFKTCVPSYNFLKGIPFYIDLYLRPIYEALRIPGFLLKYKRDISPKICNLLLRVWKFILLIPLYLTLPFYKFAKLFQKRKKLAYFGPVSWKWIKQRPHFVALGLEEHGDYDVTYTFQSYYKKYLGEDSNLVSNNTISSKHFKVKPIRISPSLGKWTDFRNSAKNMWRTLFMNYDIIIFTHPVQLNYVYHRVLKARGVKLYYEMMDNYSYWENDLNEYTYKEKQLISFCENVFVSSDSLRNKLVEEYQIESSKICLVRNGYDRELFESMEKHTTELKSNNIVYIGTVDDWFDFESIEYLASKRPNINIEIVGPGNAELIKEFKKKNIANIRFLGPIEHDLVPSYIQDSDILMMPFLINDIVSYVDPVKMYEYLYFKKPVISKYWDELEQFKDYALFYEDKESFLNCVDRAQEFKFNDSSEYQKLMDDSIWDHRVAKIVDVLKRKE